MNNNQGFLGIDTTLNDMYLSQALTNRTIHFISEFDREECYKAIYLMERIERLDDLENLPVEKRIITIVLNSYGGSCYSHLAWASTIERLMDKGYTIKTHVQGVAMSCGFMQAITGTKGHRTMARHSYIMCHSISSATYGSHQAMIEDVEHTNSLWDKFKNQIIKYTYITDEQLEDIKRRKYDWFMDAETALKLGCIDKIV